MIKYLLLCFSVIIVHFGFGQARIVLNNDVFVRLNGGTAATPVFVVLDNPNANALTTAGTGGNWVSEDEYNKLRWRIGANTGNYQIPYTTLTNVKIPYSMQITTAGVGGTHIDFSSFPTNNMNFPRPSMVTHMTDALTGSTDNSLWVIDRFWISDAMNYTTRPTTVLTFGYNPAETGGANLLSPGNMVAQRFQSTTQTWNVSPALVGIFFGNDNFPITNVNNVSVPAGELWEAWTLSDRMNLLPVDLLFFTASCETNFVELNWATASESNSSHFDIEKSTDGFNWNVIHQTPAQGNSTQTTNYSYRDYNPEQSIAYYRLRQFDFDLTSTLYDIQSVQACAQSEGIITVINQLNGQYQINVFANQDDEFEVNLHDLSGKRVRATKSIQAVSGDNVFLFNDDQLSTGIYMLTVSNPNTLFTYKLLIQK